MVTDLGGSSDTGVNVVLQPDGKILMAASGSAPGLVRCNNNGTLHNTLSGSGIVITDLGQNEMGTDPFATHGSLLLEIRNGLFSNSLDLDLSDFAAPASSSVQEAVVPLTSSWYAASLSSSNLVFVNKYGVTQFRPRFDRDDIDDLNADYAKFFTGETSTENQPQLIVTYILQQ